MTRQIPMLFSAAMMQAHLAGRKTETRRTMAPSNTYFNGGAWTKLDKAQTWDWNSAWVDPGPSPAGNPGPYLKLPWLAGDDDPFEDTVHRIYPKVQPGDLIWARESYRFHSIADLCKPSIMTPGSGIEFEACGNRAGDLTVNGGFVLGKLRPGMFMPKWASRLTLRVKEVGVERLQDISDADARAEGIEQIGQTKGVPIWRNYQSDASLLEGGGLLMPTASYHSLWNHINGPGAWGANPWVVVTRYEPIWENVLHLAGRSEDT
ncbi:MAG: hypothetical protein AAFQ58_19050 [Pseudomonadota bacterium]